MSELTTLQAAARCGVQPSVIRSWIAAGILRPTGTRVCGQGTTLTFSEAQVDAFRGMPGVRKDEPAPIERIAASPRHPGRVRMPMGLRLLEKMGRFEPATEPPVGGGELLGRILIGADWLKVYRSDNGVVYHEQAEWMDDDPDWMENPEFAETLVLLEAA